MRCSSARTAIHCTLGGMGFTCTAATVSGRGPLASARLLVPDLFFSLAVDPDLDAFLPHNRRHLVVIGGDGCLWQAVRWAVAL